MVGHSGFTWKKRYTVLVILFWSWIVSYLDRMVISTAIPYIAKDFNLSPVAMGAVMSAFFIGYTTCQIPGGFLVDRFGARKVMLWALSWWTAFTVFTGMVSSLAPMLWVRALFGVGEGVAPASTFRMVANWFPAKERGTATGVMISSNSLGPALAPIIAALIISAWGWRATFYAMAIPGILTVLWIWYSLPENPSEKKGITAGELEEIKENVSAKVAAESNYSFWQVFKVPAVWQSGVILFLYDFTIWGFRAWLPTYLIRGRGFGLMKMGYSVSLPFFAGTIGYMIGGWLSDNPFKHRRKLPLIVNQWIAAVCLYFTYAAPSPTACIVWMTLSGFFLSVAFGAFWALPMSTISKAITGRGMAIVNTGGQIGGAISPLLIGYLVQLSGGGYGTTFALMTSGCIAASMFALLVRSKKEEPGLATSTTAN
jgi:sugar phosphate permease